MRRIFLTPPPPPSLSLCHWLNAIFYARALTQGYLSCHLFRVSVFTRSLRLARVPGIELELELDLDIIAFRRIAF